MTRWMGVHGLVGREEGRIGELFIGVRSEGRISFGLLRDSAWNKRL